ncbi:MAG: Glycosyl transferase group 1 [Candidatus Woesebacteria bacterium GW2011_GWA2_40_7]|uniref:Glycosyl transferase group 1 n=3 Tax=Candidatus Woeseibacteriota TaxID=1752722 RepID=A0A0G0LUV5_9BACT|nr:MAG: Glycosyl transferase group 1 [Candidatus Woesebacteria bacterium GW2011_GWB1_39_10]KKR74389.1 MAG: Glycosyl transferase group 1 [Candidatus Woesebacteria bacterium GW2011_GWA2_40_7]KKS90771.1 MAG: Glycosyl transferase group 1 [Candidatus Woesebacteria bacterium GW2011_GWA1_43_12]
MKILMLVPFLPIDQMSGGQTRWYHLIKLLSKKHNITLMSLIKDNKEKEYLPEIEKYCEKVMVFKRPKSPWTFRNLFLTAISFNPLVVIRNLSLDERSAIKKELTNNKYDVIHAETFYVMPHIPKTSVPIVLVEPTIEFSVYQHYVDNEVSFFFKPIYLFDVIKLKFWEKFYWKRASRLFAVSVEDKKIMQDEIPGIKVGVIPNGVDVDYFEEKKVLRKFPPRALYHGDYKWMQNVEAVNILIKEIWPVVRARVKGVKLWISGRNVPEKIIEFSKKYNDIEISESLKDNRDAYKAASVLVTPIMSPGGTRLKVLEAMASGLPVVSTPVGVAGLGITQGKQALVSQNIKDLAEMTINVLSNKKLAEKLASEGKSFVSANFDWHSIVSRLDKAYSELLE